MSWLKALAYAEHIAHIGYTGGIPAADVLVEGSSIVEHIAHIGHTGGVPAPDVLVEGVGIVEHITSYLSHWRYPSCRCPG